ncbi:MAG: hypothetical protein KDJ35_02830 [Alphaproteobacteria bacterium]|nr:hypothetical protein [Alphaproteobacteria bacterium]
MSDQKENPAIWIEGEDIHVDLDRLTGGMDTRILTSENGDRFIEIFYSYVGEDDEKLHSQLTIDLPDHETDLSGVNWLILHSDKRFPDKNDNLFELVGGIAYLNGFLGTVNKLFI